MTDEEMQALITLTREFNATAVTTPQPPPVNDVFAAEPAPPRTLEHDLIEVIERTIKAHPRSLQQRIGPSEIGTPCLRKLGYKLASTGQAQEERAAWRPTVGTAVHTWLQEAFERENKALGWDRWLTEQTITAGVINGVDITGHADLYDALTHTVIDWKIPGPSSIREKRTAKDPGVTYRVQAHCYGKGFAAAGYEVEHVAVMFLPSAGELADHYYWTEPYDESIAIAAFARANGVAKMIDQFGRDVFAMLPAVHDYCHLCPWWRPNHEGDLSLGCPGVPPTH